MNSSGWNPEKRKVKQPDRGAVEFGVIQPLRGWFANRLDSGLRPELLKFVPSGHDLSATTFLEMP